MLTNKDATAATDAISTRLNTFMFSLAMSTVTPDLDHCVLLFVPGPTAYTTHDAGASCDANEKPHILLLRLTHR